jgi:hypothetical protein
MLNASFYGFFFSLDCDIAAFLKFGCFSDFLRNYYSAFSSTLTAAPLIGVPTKRYLVPRIQGFQQISG